MTWQRFDETFKTGYRLGDVEVTDNGAGMGPARGAGRWALSVGGRWVANIDFLADAKRIGQAHYDAACGAAS